MSVRADGPSQPLPGVRERFSSLQRQFVFLDAPGGSQVPDEVADAVRETMVHASANLGAGYETSRRVGEILGSAEQRASVWFGCDPDEVTFGASMTSLNFMLSRTAARSLRPGDEILTTALDHDAGVAPWLELARDRDLVVRTVDISPETTLDYADLERKLTPRTRVVAFAWASNAIGTVTDAARVCRLAHEAGALAWVDAVHYAAHEPIDVRAIDADVLICSAYKFCGPHLGLAYVRRGLAESWDAYTVRPTPPTPVGRRFANGTFPFELLEGFRATVDYIESIGGFPAIVPYERALGQRFLDGIPDTVTVYGAPTMADRVPTFLINVDGIGARELAAYLARNDVGVWAGDTWYALELYRRLGYDDAAVRVGFAHYNSPREVDRLLDLLSAASGDVGIGRHHRGH